MTEPGVFEIINFDPDLESLKADVAALDRDKFLCLYLNVRQAYGPVYLAIAVWLQEVWPECDFDKYTYELMKRIQELMNE